MYEISMLNLKSSVPLLCLSFTVLFADSKQRPLLAEPRRDREGWTEVVAGGPVGCQV